MPRIFISSAQKEFALERRALEDYIDGDALLAEPLYLAKYSERMSTGIRDMIRLCREAGLREPEFAVRDGYVQILWRPKRTARVAGQVTGQVAGQVTEEILRALEVLGAEMSPPADPRCRAERRREQGMTTHVHINERNVCRQSGARPRGTGVTPVTNLYPQQHLHFFSHKGCYRTLQAAQNKRNTVKTTSSLGSSQNLLPA